MILKDYLFEPVNKAERQTDAFLKLSGSWQDNRSCEDIMDRRSSRRFDAIEDHHVFD